ncbi:hypothetical protein CHLRE_08g358540v5 [Chlamydomonas reinhardtii]|uniref:YdbS-like PH domain-containing protein n=1 Tax=Chlamydomonas reinhardtii TaxID=3055 RepID=A0A2K3DG80_CHLRE|nr:uncharacterized protein CHLRE_08g358540v5 [Chlamydomonas reinhardtii]PNW79532.1 hypothetical protein CHLRE_08g358540v5 [Chlamydomonas reinhardtii]
MMLQQRTCVAGAQRSVAQRVAAPVNIRGRSRLVVRASADDEDAELEKRLAKLRTAKGATPYGEGVKAAPKRPVVEDAPTPKKKKVVEKAVYDYSDEKLHYEGPPHRGDLAVNLALGTTLFWIPLTIAALGRGLFVNYRFTDKRISVKTTAPWKNEQLDAAYQEVKEVRSIPRGIGAWGDMVVVLRDGSKIEMRALDNFRELQAYILRRRDELTPKDSGSSGRGAQLTQEELLGEPVAGGKGKGKGFA